MPCVSPSLGAKALSKRGTASIRVMRADVTEGAKSLLDAPVRTVRPGRRRVRRPSDRRHTQRRRARAVVDPVEVGPLELRQDAVPDRQRIARRLQADGVFLDAGYPEVMADRAGRDDERVVGERLTPIGDDRPAISRSTSMTVATRTSMRRRRRKTPLTG